MFFTIFFCHTELSLIKLHITLTNIKYILLSVCVYFHSISEPVNSVRVN